MGHGTFHLVVDLLRRGVHVLLEHPVLPDEVERAVSEASRRRVTFHINTLFPALDAPRAFIDDCRARPGPPLYLDVLATDRSLYAVLDILRNSLGMLGASTVPRASGNGIESFEGTIGGVPALVRVQRAGLNGGGRLSDGAAGYLVDCRVTQWFDDGALTLLSVSGPVVWNGSYRRTAPLGADAWRAIHAPRTSYGDLLDQQTRANLEAIDALRAHATEGISPDAQCPDHLLDVARAWEHIARQLAAESC
jgi:NAD-dependent oxidoreductase involved in siderophore biosynthesis